MESNATRERRGRDMALEMVRGMDRVIAARGKNVVVFDMKNTPPDTDTLLRHLLGPTGNLRAPTMRQGNTLLVGFHEEEFARILLDQNVPPRNAGRA